MDDKPLPTSAEPHANPWLLDDEAFEALEDLLVSDAVPEDCMNLEMLDGYLAAVVAAPHVIAPEAWLPGVWSAHGDEALAFASGSRMQQAIRLVRAYYNELATTIGEPEGWEPFCYAAGEGDAPGIGEEWIEGFAQGLELWPADWDANLPEARARAVADALDAILAPWESDGAGAADDETRLIWLEGAVAQLAAIVAEWRALGLARPAPLPELAPATVSRAQAGRNEACPCGSGKKFKKCCGSAA